MAELVPHPHEQLALGAVILGGIAALIFGFAYLGKSIVEPLQLKPRTVETLAERDSREAAELRTRDTDQDGLVDYDEIYVWNTSAYLPDTDSDGYADKTEIESGNDPNCPRDRDCLAARGAGGAEATGGTAPSVGGLIPPAAAEQLFNTQEGFGNLGEIFASLPPAEIRALLLERGVPQERLDALDDATLTALYRYAVEQALVELRAQSEATGETESSTGTATETP